MAMIASSILISDFRIPISDSRHNVNILAETQFPNRKSEIANRKSSKPSLAGSEITRQRLDKRLARLHMNRVDIHTKKGPIAFGHSPPRAIRELGPKSPAGSIHEHTAPRLGILQLDHADVGQRHLPRVGHHDRNHI